MPNILDTIQVSGSSYDIKDKNAPSVSAVTQQEYDNLPSSAKTSNIFFVISDATPIDISNYWTSAQTQSAITQATSGKADTSAVTAVQDSLSGYVTTNTAQDITSAKTFLWSNSNNKPIIFKQTSNNVKLGFIMKNSAQTNNELATFEFRPDTYTDSSSVHHPLLYLGHYRNNATATAGVAQTMVGFRQYDQKGAAKTPFSLTTSFKNYFAPLGFKNGDTMITTDNTGVADFSTVLGGLKLQKVTQNEYDALVSGGTVDNNTLYVIT